MEFSLFLSLVAYGCATTFSPGPNNVLLLSCSGQYGFRKCLKLLFGIWTGLLTVMLLCGFCCLYIGSLIPEIEPYARLVGALYIAYLGVEMLLPSKKKGASASSDPEVPLTYLNGFLLQFLNIKILMLGVAAYCSFILPHNPVVTTTLIFSVTMALCAACGNLIWVTVGALLYPFYQKYRLLFQIILAGLLFWCVYKILIL